jgi:hypothetical protein
MPRVASAITAIGALAVLAAGIHHGTFAASDSDPYGYVSEADLMARGALRIDQRFALAMPWPHPDLTFSPPGYRPTSDGFIVPIYSPGLPVVMALFQRIKGREAVFYVIPLLGALAVWMTARLGTKIHGPLAGVLAAAIVGTNVIFLYQLTQPVSDLATTAWWTMSLALVVSGGSIAALGAGLAASMAILTRPNLVPLAAVIGCFEFWNVARASTGDRGTAIRRLAFFVAGAVPGCLAVAAINWHLYGSPLQSGYWDEGLLYGWAHLLPNLDRYPRWLIQARSAYLFLALAALWLARGRQVYLLLAFSVVVFLSYLFYVPWGRQEWGYLRFVLPAFPALAVLTVAVVRELTRRISANDAASAAVTAVLFVALAAWQGNEAVRLGAFATKPAEQRYVDVGRYVAAALPQNALFISGAESGSLRYYSNRLTLRFDLLDEHWLDRAVDALRERGYRPYFVLEEAEETPFRDHFGDRNVLGKLDWPPAVERTEPIRVRIYDPADRDRFRAGEPITTGNVDIVQKPRVTVR